jgi:hypothetical protein
MTTPALLIVAAAAAAVGVAAPARGGPAGTICVDKAPGCVRTIQAALDKARPGDVIRIANGTYAGGITIRKSVSLVGAGPGRTVVRGGGPVVTITPTARRVSIDALTITGGRTTTDPAGRCGADIPTCGQGYLRATALGGGIEIAPSTKSGPGGGAAVTISRSVVSGNRAEPRATVPSAVAKCPSGPCAFAQAGGGGIDNWGTLTLIHTVVSGNAAAGPLTAQADGGGILSEDGSRLTLEQSVLRGNTAAASGANARLAGGGGIYVFRRGILEVRSSTIVGNSAVLKSGYPESVADMNANSGGIFVGNGGSATVDRTRLTSNRVVVSVPAGRAAGFDSALLVTASPLTLSNSTIRGNSVSVEVGTSPEGGSGGGLEADSYAVISKTQVTGNRVSVTSSAGRALATAVVNMFVSGPRGGTFSDGMISGNSVRATSTSGAAQIQGAGLANNGPLELRNVRIERNSGAASAPDGWAHGGGVFNGLVFHVPKPDLELVDVTISGNRLTASAGLPVQGGGVYTAGFAVRSERASVAGNAPDQCFGCR